VSGKMIALESTKASSHGLQSISPTHPESHRGNCGDLGPKLQDLPTAAAPACVEQAPLTRLHGLAGPSAVNLERFGSARCRAGVAGRAGRRHPISIDPSSMHRMIAIAV